MLPVLVIFADIIAIVGGLVVAVTTLDVTAHAFTSGLRLYFHVRDVFSGLVKAHFFGVIIALMGSYYGLRSEGGAQGVGVAMIFGTGVALLTTIVAPGRRGLALGDNVSAVYLGLSVITREADGTLALDGRGEVVDWLVRMRRVPAGRTLDRLIADETLTVDQVDAVGEALARFYAEAERSRVSADEYVQQLRNEHAISRDIVCAYENGLARPLLDEVQRFLGRSAGLART